EQAMRDFLGASARDGAEVSLLAADASFRRYLRVQRGGERAVLMDAPPEKEDVRPFLDVARRLAALGFSAPRVLAEDSAAGFVLLEDLGDTTFTRALAADPACEPALYELAVETLVALHRAQPPRDGLPRYDDERLQTEADLLVDWYWPEVHRGPAPSAARERYAELWRPLFEWARQVPETLVLRDFHVDNLMWLAGRNGVARCGLLDFQDAVAGPVTYDLVSLLEDARRDVPAALATRLKRRYVAAMPELDPEAFDASYAILGAQRSAKIVGIFTRLWRRDGKAGYLRHVPRVWRWLESDLRHPALADMRAWFEVHFPPALRRAPA
ncbi:MAG: phosphotransferase, partial [Acetobacterales bacterium]